MTEILTESFCERCGTRYSFESAGPRRSHVGRVRTLSRGVRNYVMSDGTTFSEALADARSEDEISATAHQLDAFHRTFNFCLTCRQYTCGNCWNDADGRCLTCAPVPGLDLPEPASMVAVAETPATFALVDEAAPQAWPEADLSAARTGIVPGVAAPPFGAGVEADEAEIAAESEVATGTLPDQEVAAQAEALAEAEAVAGVDVEPATLAESEVVAAPVLGIAPGQSVEEAVAAYEALLIAEEAAGLVGPEPVAAAGPASAVPEPVAAVVPEPVAAAEPEPVAAAEPAPIVRPEEPADVTATEPAAEPETAPAAAATVESAAPFRDDVVVQPTWPVPSPTMPTAAPAAPAAPPAPPAPPAPTPVSPWLTVAPDDGTRPEPQWSPVPIQGRFGPNAGPAQPAIGTIAAHGDPAALWAASAREVMTGGPRPAQPTVASTPTPQPCISCGLPLSASARFCRRCGSRQG